MTGIVSGGTKSARIRQPMMKSLPNQTVSHAAVPTRYNCVFFSLLLIASSAIDCEHYCCERASLFDTVRRGVRLVT